MSIITNIKNVFSKTKAFEHIGIALRKNSIAYCAKKSSNDKVNGKTNDTETETETETEKNCHSIDIINNSFIDTLKNLTETYPLKGECHLVLSNNQSHIVQVDKPSVPDEEINDAVKWQIKDLVNIDPENMVVDYFDGPVLTGGAEKINVVCTSKNDLLELVTALNIDNLNVTSITTEEFAFARLIPINSDAVLMVCQQPNEEVNLLIIKDGRLFFSRRLRGLSQIATKTEDELSMGVIDSLSLEIQRSTDYFERQLKQSPIRSIEVIVPIAHEAFLARKLAENTNIDVKLLTMPDSFENERENAVAIAATQLNFMEAQE